MWNYRISKTKKKKNSARAGGNKTTLSNMESDNRLLNSNNKCQEAVTEYLPSAEKNDLTQISICRKTTVHKQKWNESSCRFKTANLPVIDTKIPSKNLPEEKDLARKI